MSGFDILTAIASATVHDVLVPPYCSQCGRACESEGRCAICRATSVVGWGQLEPDGRRFIPWGECGVCGRAAGNDKTRTAVRWLIWSPPDDGGWKTYLKVCVPCQNERWRSMVKSYDQDRDLDAPNVANWTQRIYASIRKRAIRLGVDPHQVEDSAFCMGQAVNTSWRPPSDDDLPSGIQYDMPSGAYTAISGDDGGMEIDMDEL